jgi:prepilin-type N-terminal cleavage/methylation domain-containing protein/prepilin-type processing-associated H-X9-DG protein
MPPSRPFRQGRATRLGLAAFTLTELLVVLAVVALLVCLRLPALARVKTQTWITQCSGNLRQVTLSFLLYGGDNNARLPTTSIGFWAWDLPDPIFQLLNHFGQAQSNMFFCPSNPYQNSLWNFGAPDYHLTGYAYTFPGTGAQSSLYSGNYVTNINSSIIPQQIQIGTNFVVPTAATRVLVADAEICAGPSYNPNVSFVVYNFTDIQGGAPAFPDGRHHRASHLVGQFPLGGNQAMLDGHVEWRAWRSTAYSMIQRNTAQAPIGTPCFLW